MSNLGDYQKIVEEAHRSGSPEKWISDIRAAGFADGRKSMIPVVVGGTLGGALFGGAAVAAYKGISNLRKKRRDAIEAADRDARRKLTEAIRQHENANSDDACEDFDE